MNGLICYVINSIRRPCVLRKPTIFTTITTAQAAAAQGAQWISATEKAGSIPRVMKPADTEKFASDQYEVYERLGRELQIELK